MKRSSLHSSINRSLLKKVRIIICCIAIFASILISGVAMYFYHYISFSRLLNNSVAATTNAAVNMNINDSDIIERFVSICGTENFSNNIEYLIQHSSNYAAVDQVLQTTLNDLSHCNYLVESPLILTGDGQNAYTLYRSLLRIPASQIFTKAELSSVHGVTYLIQRNSPFRVSSMVIPMVIPVSMGNSYLTIPTDGSTPDAYIVFFLNKDKLQLSLNTSNTNQTNSTYYIATSNGAPISLDNSGNVPDIFSNEDLKNMIQALSDGKTGLVQAEESTSFIIATKLNHSNMILVSHVYKESLFSILGQTGYSLLFIAIMIFSLIIFISFFMSTYVTKPIMKLVSIVHKIECNEYNIKERFNTKDEVAQLLESINGMYDTIQAQMNQIKIEESAKYKTELKLMTEQINPHFLYNTLEVIQSEVVKKDSGAATTMIQYLAEYLRIVLSGGADVIPISNEIKQANAYIKIMNQRFQQFIIFMYKIDPGLGNTLILKTILQPLIENSIKHGFGIDSSGPVVSVPTIEVFFSKTSDGRLRIEVSDNGLGFDTERVWSILLDKARIGRHIGVHNVYHRLISYYGECNVEFQLNSIPYYRNSIIILIKRDETS